MPPGGLGPLPFTFGSCQDYFSASWGKVSGQVLASLLLLLYLDDGLHGGHLGDVPLAVLHLLGSLLMLLLASDVLVLRQPLKCRHHLSHSQPQSVQA